MKAFVISIFILIAGTILAISNHVTIDLPPCDILHVGHHCVVPTLNPDEACCFEETASGIIYYKHEED